MAPAPIAAPAPLGTTGAPPRWLTTGLLLWCLLVGAACALYANWEMLFDHAAPALQGNDDTGYYLWLRSAVIDGDFDFADDLAAAPTLRPEARDQWLGAPRTALGRVANKYPPGWAVATAPAFLVGHGIARLIGAPADGWSPPYSIAIWLYHLALATLGVWLAYRVACRFVAKGWALIGVLTLWLASPLVYYHTGRISLVHGLLFTLIAAICHHTFALREHPAAGWRWWALGGLGGLAVLTRGTAVCYLLFPAAMLFPVWRKLSLAERGKALLQAALPACAAAALLGGSIWVQHGRLWAEPYPGERFFWLRPHLWEVFFSPFHGLFYWHPLLLLGLGGAAVGAWRGLLPRSWWVSIALLSYVNAAWYCWWFGSSFGNRAFEGVVLFAMVGLGWALERITAVGGRAGRLAAIGLVGAALGAGTLLLALFVTHAIPSERAVTYADMVQATGVLFTRTAR